MSGEKHTHRWWETISSFVIGFGVALLIGTHSVTGIILVVAGVVSFIIARINERHALDDPDMDDSL